MYWNGNEYEGVDTVNKLTLIENGIIPVYEGEQGQAVNARELHEFLEVGKDFTTWIKDRLEKYGFFENEDFIVFPENGENLTGGRPKTEYILTLDTAKEIAMVQNNEKGSKARKYFIEVEKRYKQLKKPKCIEDVLIESLQEMKNMRQQVEIVKQQAAAVKGELQGIRDVVEIRPSESWRNETNVLITKICIKLKDYQKPKEEIYKALQERAACDLKRRLDNMRARILLNGGSKSKANSLNFLDVITDDKKLIEIYTAIVKELAIKYKVA